MSKREKRKKSARRGPDLSPAALLRSRLDGLLSNPGWIARDISEQQSDLEVLARGVDTRFFLTTLCKAALSAPPEVQAQLQQVVPPWLKARGYAQLLAESLERELSGDPARAMALNWLSAAGVEVRQPSSREPAELFYKAYAVDDGSQAMVVIFTYRDRQRRRVHGMGFLIDYNPPWEGALKDVLVVPQGDPDSTERNMVDYWNSRGWMPLKPIDATEAKKRVLTALAANRREGIRLPRDLIAERDLFFRCVLPLPDEPDTPSFTPEDFATLSRTGKSPEEISRFEQKVGRLVRLPDGQKVLVMGAPFDEDEEDWV